MNQTLLIGIVVVALVAIAIFGIWAFGKLIPFVWEAITKWMKGNDKEEQYTRGGFVVGLIVAAFLSLAAGHGIGCY